MKVGSRTVLAVILALTAVVACSRAPSNELSSLSLDARISSQDALNEGADEDYQALLALLEAEPTYADEVCSQLSPSESGLVEADFDGPPGAEGGSVYAQASNRPTGKKGLWAMIRDWCTKKGKEPAPPPPKKDPDGDKTTPPKKDPDGDKTTPMGESPYGPWKCDPKLSRGCTNLGGWCDPRYAKPRGGPEDTGPVNGMCLPMISGSGSINRTNQTIRCSCINVTGDNVDIPGTLERMMRHLITE
jgi:hypothetical protein